MTGVAGDLISCSRRTCAALRRGFSAPQARRLHRARYWWGARGALTLLIRWGWRQDGKLPLPVFFQKHWFHFQHGDPLAEVA